MQVLEVGDPQRNVVVDDLPDGHKLVQEIGDTRRKTAVDHHPDRPPFSLPHLLQLRFLFLLARLLAVGGILLPLYGLG